MTDTPCLQICVYCRDVSSKTSTALRHSCNDRKKALQNGPETTEEYYRADRLSQLRRQSKKTLNRMLSKMPASAIQSNKRKFGSVHQNKTSRPSRPSKRPAHGIELDEGTRTASQNARDLMIAPSRAGSFEGLPNSATYPVSQPNIASTDDNTRPRSHLPPSDITPTTGAFLEYSQMFEDGNIPRQILPSNFGDSNVPPTSLPSPDITSSIRSSLEYSQMFENGNIPLMPIPQMDIAATMGASLEYSQMFEDGNIPRQIPFLQPDITSILAGSLQFSQDDNVRFHHDATFHV